MLPILGLLLGLSLAGTPPPPIDCDKACARAVDACAAKCKAKKKSGGDAKVCQVQCDTVIKQCKDRCLGAKSSQSNPAKAHEIRKKIDEEEKTP